MNEIRVSNRAEADLCEIWLQIAQDNLHAADRLRESVVASFQILADFPGIGQTCDDLSAGLRCSPVGRYIIFFRPMAGGIEVIRVVHGARDLTRVFEM